jgi:hypothetical protein
MENSMEVPQKTQMNGTGDHHVKWSMPASER